MAGPTKSAVLTLRSESHGSDVKKCMKVKVQLEACVSVGFKVPAIWCWIVGKTSKDDVGKTSEDEGALQLPDPQILALREDMANVLRRASQPTFGVAIGHIEKWGIDMLRSCDFVFADASSVSWSAFNTSHDIHQTACSDPDHQGMADVKLENMEQLYASCKRIARQVERIGHEKLAEFKLVLHRHKKSKRPGGQSNKIRGSNKIHSSMQRSDLLDEWLSCEISKCNYASSSSTGTMGQDTSSHQVTPSLDLPSTEESELK